MKKLVISIVMVTLTINCFAQLTQVRPSYSTVYEWNGMPRHGEIRYNGSMYFLCGESMNRFESSMHTIVLGETKEEAINSLQQLDSLKENMTRKDEIIVMGVNGKETTLFKVMGTLCFATNGVAGESDVLYLLKHEKAIKAINNFNEEQ
jgi:hypothetical protein